MRYLLDTSFIVDLLNDRRNRRQFAASLLAAGGELCICAINLIEVYSGMRPGEEQKTAALLNEFTYLDITQEIARRAGWLRSDWLRKGRQLSVADVAIAAVALANGLALVTDNRKDFPMRDLVLAHLPN